MVRPGMKCYRVTTVQIHTAVWEIEATSEEDAISQVHDGLGRMVSTVYDDTLKDATIAEEAGE